jgi:hypothetical protein
MITGIIIGYFRGQLCPQLPHQSPHVPTANGRAKLFLRPQRIRLSRTKQSASARTSPSGALQTRRFGRLSAKNDPVIETGQRVCAVTAQRLWAAGDRNSSTDPFPGFEGLCAGWFVWSGPSGSDVAALIYTKSNLGGRG